VTKYFIPGIRIKQIMRLGLPVVAGTLATNLMALIDLAMVSRLDAFSLASVGIVANSFISYFLVVHGVSAGVQAMVSRRLGEGRKKEIGGLLSSAIAIASITSTFIALLAYFTLPHVLSLLIQDDLVYARGLEYSSTLILSGIFVGTSMAFIGFWVGVGKIKIALVVVIIQLLANVVFNYCLIFGNFGFPRLEISGAGLGTTLAAALGFFAHIAYGLHYFKHERLTNKYASISEVRTLINLSLPSGLQQFAFSIGVVVWFSIVGLMGTEALAVFTVLFGFNSLFFLLANGLGLPLITLVGTSLGKGEVQNAKQWGWDVALLGALVISMWGILCVAFSQSILELLMDDKFLVQAAVLPFMIMAMSYGVEAYGRILSFGLIGAGAPLQVMKTALTQQWFLRLPLFYVAGVVLGYGLTGMYAVLASLYILQTKVFISMWRKEEWGKLVV
jgi:MATE family multidrug resistance protein